MLDRNASERLLNEREVAAQLTVSVATIRRWRLFGQGPRYVKIGAAVRYRADDLAAWVNSRPSGGENNV
jgi:predicted DNA-binding transcriptional regulator AlpA